MWSGNVLREIDSTDNIIASVQEWKEDSIKFKKRKVVILSKEGDTSHKTTYSNFNEYTIGNYENREII